MEHKTIRGFIRAATLMVATAAGYGQTQVDLTNQVRQTVDFSQFNLTKPVRADMAIPAQCTVGELFFKTNAAPTQSLFACTATNTWSVIGDVNAIPALPSVAGNAGKLLTTNGTVVEWSLVPPGSMAVESNATLIGTRPIVNFLAGPGIIETISDTGSKIQIQHAVDTSLIETTAAGQAGTSLLCASASGSAIAYTCSLNPTLASYTAGMRLRWIPDVAGAGGSTTLEVNGLGPKDIFLAEGSLNPATADIQAGHMYDLWYDGAAFRYAASVGLRIVSVTPQPTCAAGNAGRLWYVAGSTGVKDDVSICAKDAADAYAWRVLY